MRGEGMISAESPWWKRKILYYIPKLFKKCPEGNYHWFWHRLCFCVDNCDLLDMKTGKEYDHVSKRPYISGPLNDGSILKHFADKSKRGATT